MTAGERIHVERWPAGGWVVRLEGHPTPVSHHDTEEEAQARAEAYRRGLERGMHEPPPVRPGPIVEATDGCPRAASDTRRR